MTPDPPEPEPRGTILNSGQWERLRRKDPEEWMQLFGRVMDVAKSLVRERVGERFGLVQLHGGDSLAAMGALGSAWSSFQRHFLRDAFRGAWTVEDLTVHLIRITLNRLQRERRRQDRLGSAAAGQPLLNAVRADDDSPDEGVSLAEFLTKMTGAIDELLGQMETPQKREAIWLWLSGVRNDRRTSQSGIARQLGVNQSTVSRWLDEFKADVRRMLNA
jgi:hypothetical protein